MQRVEGLNNNIKPWQTDWPKNNLASYISDQTSESNNNKTVIELKCNKGQEKHKAESLNQTTIPTHQPKTMHQKGNIEEGMSLPLSKHSWTHNLDAVPNFSIANS